MPSSSAGQGPPENTRRRRAFTSFDLLSPVSAEELGSNTTDEEEPSTLPTSTMATTNHNVEELQEETDHFLHLYQDLTNNVFSDDSNQGKPIILSSLSKLDELLQANTTTVTRATGGLNVDTVSTEDGKYFLRCHLATLLDFSHYDQVPYKHAFEAAASIALAAHHMNEGIGWIVPELAGLNQRCPIRFTTEFTDTEYDQGVSLKHVIDMTDRLQNKPCAFIGATKSTVSIPTAIVTGIRGYPQISSQSTSEQLDDLDQFPLFGRTVPSDVDNAVPIVKFFREKLNATHLSVLHVNNGYGNAFADDLKLAAQKHAPDLAIEEHELSEHPNPQLIQEVIHALKELQFSYIFAALNDNVIDDVLLEAYRQGVAGNGLHNWFFSNTFADIDDRYFELGSELHLAYRGVGRMQVSGGHQGMASFDTFACNLRTLRSSPPDLDYFATLLPQKEYQNTYDFPGQARDMSKMPYIYDEDFMNPVPKMADRTSPAYEAAVALGLAACNVVAKSLPLTGQHHFDEFKHTTFKGVEAEVKFLNESGTRDPETTLFAVENEIEAKVEVTNPDGSKKIMVKFHAEVSDIYDHGVWEHLEDYIFNDGTSTVQPDLTPVEDVEHHYIHTPLKIVGMVMYLFILAMAIRYWVWTEKHKNTRVVRASQPLFLRVILAGVIIFATAIVPLNIDDRIASIQGCSTACTIYYWFFFMGFSIMFSGLFTKIYRVNQIMNNPVKFKRVKVTVKDVIRPMAAIIGVNFVLLVAMTAAAPSEWVIEVSDYDQHGRPTETYGHCKSDDQLPYYITLGLVNFLALCFAMKQSYDTRKLATEFSESRYIFYAMIGIIVALFQGIPVLVLVRDDPAVQDFIKCSVITVTCCSVLLFLFVPKVKYLKKQLNKSQQQRHDESVIVSGLEPMDTSNKAYGNNNNSSNRYPQSNLRKPLSSLSGLSSNYSSGSTTSSDDGVRFTMKSPAELNQENDEMRRKLNMRNVSLGTLATESSVSGSSDGSSGVKILARKSPTELLDENRKLKKMLREAKKRQGVRGQSIQEEENESDSEDGDRHKHKRQVSFKLEDGEIVSSSELVSSRSFALEASELASELASSIPELTPLVMPTESEGEADGSIGDVTASSIIADQRQAAATAQAANNGGVPSPSHDIQLPSILPADDEIHSDDETAPNSSDDTNTNATGDVIGRFKSGESVSDEFKNEESVSDEFKSDGSETAEAIEAVNRGSEFDLRDIEEATSGIAFADESAPMELDDSTSVNSIFETFENEGKS